MEEREKLKSLLMKVKEEGEIVGLKCNIQKTKIMASGPITSLQVDRETIQTGRLYFGAQKKMVTTAAMNLKDACSLKVKLWQP